MKIAILVTRMDIGGVPDHIMTLIDGYGRDVDATIITDHIHEQHAKDLAQKNVDVILLPMARKLSPSQDIKTFQALRKILDAHAFDILHTHTSKPALLGALIGATRRSIKVVNTAHNLGFLAMPALPKRLVFWVYDRILGTIGFDAIITVSDKVKNAATAAWLLPKKRIFAIPNGIRTARFDKIPQSTSEKIRAQLLERPKEQDLTICVARLVWFKGLDTLIDAMPAVLKKNPNSRLAIVGDGELLDELNQQTAKLGLQDHIIFLGERDDVPELLSAADLFVLPSVSEGMPISILEAMAVGLPIVATDVGGVSEIVHDSENGFLVEASDPIGMANAMNQVLGSTKEKQRLGENSKTLLTKQFSQASMVQKTEALYRRLISPSLKSSNSHART